MGVQVYDLMLVIYRDIWNMRPWAQLTDIYTVSSVANQNYIVLDKGLQYVRRATSTDSTSIDRLDYRNVDVSAWSDFSLANNATPAGARPRPFITPLPDVGVKTQLTTADTVKVQSSSSADKSVVVTVIGLLSTGQRTSEDITLNSTDATTQVAGTITFTTISSVSKQAKTSGEVRVYASDGTTQLATIDPVEESPSYSKIRFADTPTTSANLQIIAKKRYQIPLGMNDTPFADVLENALIAGTIAEIYAQDAKKNPDLGQMMGVWAGRYQSELATLKTGDEPNKGASVLVVPAMPVC